jgi:hypothetical protein
MERTADIMTLMPWQDEPVRLLTDAIRRNSAALDASDTGVGKPSTAANSQNARILGATPKPCALSRRGRAKNFHALRRVPAAGWSSETKHQAKTNEVY